MAHSQKPVLGAAFNVKLPVAAWHDKPSYAIIATQDRSLNPERAQWMAMRAGSKVSLVKARIETAVHAVQFRNPAILETVNGERR